MVTKKRVPFVERNNPYGMRCRYMACCYACGAFVGPLTQYQIALHWGETRLERDEVTVTDVCTVEKFCYQCWLKVSQEGRKYTTRGDVEMTFFLIENRTTAGVRSDKTISAWAKRKLVA